MNNDWRPHFPLGKPRDQQSKILDRAVGDILNGKKNIIISAPTGIGKSAIAVCIAKWWRANERWAPAIEGEEEQVHGSYIVTSQKILQDQYVKDFSCLNDIRSSTNYDCSWVNSTCGEGLRTERLMISRDSSFKAPCGGSCPYREKKRAAVDGIALTNYSYLMSEAFYAGGMKPRSLLICDEAHVIENEVRSWASVFVDDTILSAIGLNSPGLISEDDTFKWVLDVYAKKLDEKKRELASQIEKMVSSNLHVSNDTVLRRLTSRFEEYDMRLCQVNRLTNDSLTAAGKKNYVSKSEVNNGNWSCSVRPLNVSSCAHAALYRLGEHRILMSATVLDKNVFCRANGLPSHGTSYINVETPFKHTSYGINYTPIVRMSKAARTPQTTSIMRDAIKAILDAHPNDKGIIHSASYELTKAVEGISSRIIVQKSSDDRAALLEHHSNSSEPTVIVSPSMTEGVDLHDDLSRFQIICKVPYPYLGDEVTKRLMEADGSWYAWTTIRTIVQSIGRSVRHENDWAMTYILDECFNDLYKRWKKYFPDYVKRSLA